MKKVFSLLLVFVLLLTTGCKTKITEENLKGVVDDRILINYYVTTHVDFEYVMLPYKLEIESDSSSEYNYFNNDGKTDNSIYIEWEILSENLSFETLTKKEMEDTKLRNNELISERVYAKLYFYDSDNKVKTVKIDFDKNLPTAKMKAIYKCQDVTYEQEYEMLDLVKGSDKYMNKIGYSGHGDSFSKSKSGGIGKNEWSETVGLSFNYSIVSYGYKQKDYTVREIRLNVNTGMLTYDIVQDEGTVNIYNGEKIKVVYYNKEDTIEYLTKLIDGLKDYDEYLVKFNNGEGVSEFYINGTYPSASSLVE